MMQEETIPKDSPLCGDKLFQKRARSALPLLVRQAQVHRKPITYEDLAEKLGMPNARNLNYPLGCIGDALKQLEREWKKKIPQIQILVVRKDTKLPGLGIAQFLGYSEIDFERLSFERKQEQVKDLQSKACEYPRWDDVIRHFNLKSA